MTVYSIFKHGHDGSFYCSITIKKGTELKKLGTLKIWMSERFYKERFSTEHSNNHAFSVCVSGTAGTCFSIGTSFVFSALFLVSSDLAALRDLG